MKKLKTGLLLSVIGCLTFFATMLSACTTKKVTLSTTGDVTSLKPGDSVQLLIDGNTPEGFTFRINEGANYAEIDANGVLTININAVPGSKVKVSAEKELVKSNEITLTVDSISLTNLVANETITAVERNEEYELSYVATPANTTEQISWVFVEGAEHAEIEGNLLKIKATATLGATIKVKAQGETLSSNELTFTVTGTEAVVLSTTGNVTELQPSASVQLLVDGNAAEGYTYEITEGSNYAEVNANGVLTIKANAVVGETIKVKATKGYYVSNEITLTVDSIDLISLIVSSTTNQVMRNNAYELSYVATPTNTTEQISWGIVDGEDYAEISGDRLIIKSTAPYGETIIVRANGETLSSNEITFTVIQFSEEGLYLDGYDEVEKLDAAGSAYTYTIDVKNDQHQNVPGKTLTYTIVEGENNLSVVQNGYNFVLTATGHGTATLRITMGEEYKDVTVNCVKAPTAITLPEVLKTKTNIEFSTGKNQDIKNFNLNFVGTNVCQNVTFKFEIWNGSAWVEDATAGTFNAGTLRFATEGKIKVTATSNSGSIAEKSVSKEFTVNDGINVSTFEEFRNALQSSSASIVGKPINIVNMQSNKLIPAFITDGTEQTSDEIIHVQTWVASGELNLLGNGYEIDLSGLATEQTSTGYIGNFITISGTAKSGNSEADHKVVIKNLTITGNVDINDDYNPSSKEPAGKLERAIFIGAYDVEDVSYLVDIDNVKIANFGVGIRVSHAVSYNNKVSQLKNVTVQNIWSNGIETASCQMVVDSINVQLCGACGLEVTPDECAKAGLNFNENQKIQFAGAWNVQNLNNGNTKYFQTKAMNGITVPILIQGSLGDKVQNSAILSNIMNANKEMNMIALQFNNVEEGALNTSEITDGVFANSIINFNDLTGVDTTHKYIRVTLAYNMGSIILYNYNYAG